MSEGNKPSIDLDALRLAIETEAETIPPGREKMVDRVRALYEPIMKMKNNRHTLDQIAKFLSDQGAFVGTPNTKGKEEIAGTTLKQYLYEIGKERGDTKGGRNANTEKRSRKSGVNSPAVAKENSAATPPSEKVSAAGNKSEGVLSTKPAMGGAFSPDKL